MDEPIFDGEQPILPTDVPTHEPTEWLVWMMGKSLIIHDPNFHNENSMIARGYVLKRLREVE
jgi:hypothetical protein